MPKEETKKNVAEPRTPLETVLAQKTKIRSRFSNSMSPSVPSSTSNPSTIPPLFFQTNPEPPAVAQPRATTIPTVQPTTYPNLDSDSDPDSDPEDIDHPDIFNGEEHMVEHWLNNVELFFKLQPRSFVSSLRRVHYALYMMGSRCEDWVVLYDKKLRKGAAGYDSWDEFKSKFKERWLDGTEKMLIRLKMEKLQQTGGIKGFVEKMEDLNVKGQRDDDYMQDLIRRGLKPELRDALVFLPQALVYGNYTLWRQNLINLGQAIEFRDVELAAKNQNSPNFQNRRYNGNRRNYHIKPEDNTGASNSNSNANGNCNGASKGINRNTRRQQLKTIPQDVLDQRKADRRCLHCGKPGHSFWKCRSPTDTGKQKANSEPQASVNPTFSPVSSNSTNSSTSTTTAVQPAVSGPVQSKMTRSDNSVWNPGEGKCIQIICYLQWNLPERKKRVELKARVVTGASACVIDPRIMQQNRIPYIARESPIIITNASGNIIEGTGRYHTKKCELLVRDEIQHGYRVAPIQCEVFPLDEGIDLILGMNWVAANVRKLSFEALRNNTPGGIISASDVMTFRDDVPVQVEESLEWLVPST